MEDGDFYLLQVLFFVVGRLVARFLLLLIFLLFLIAGGAQRVGSREFAAGFIDGNVDLAVGLGDVLSLPDCRFFRRVFLKERFVEVGTVLGDHAVPCGQRRVQHRRCPHLLGLLRPRGDVVDEARVLAQLAQARLHFCKRVLDLQLGEVEEHLVDLLLAAHLDHGVERVELLAPFPTARASLGSALAWLQAQAVEGGWDLGPRAPQSPVFPLSATWTDDHRRRQDWTVRVLALQHNWGTTHREQDP